MADTTKSVTISEISDDKKIGGREDWGNKLVVNTGLNPVVNFNFMLRIEGVFDLPCKAVKGIHRENEFDYIQEGGLNDYVHLKRKPISKPFTFQVERYVGVNWVDPMPLGTELTLPVILFVNTHVFPGLQPVRNYVFTGCTVISKDYGELNAEASGLLLETVTIAYREMICLDIPNDAYGSDTWEFDGKKREGKDKKKRKYNSNLYNSEWETSDTYSSVKMMEERAAATKWSPKDGKKPKNAKVASKELTTADMEKKAEENKWTPKKDETGHLETKHGRDYESYVSDYNEAIQQELAAATTPEEKKKIEAKKIAMGASTNRLWPEQSSAKTEEMKDSELRKYEHSSVARKNNSAKVIKGELTETEMEQKAEEKKWTPKKDKSGHLETKYGRDYEQYVTDHNKAIQKEMEAAKTTEEKKAAREKEIAMGAAASRLWPEQASARTDEMKTPKARKYQHSSTPKKYNSAKHAEKELSREEMEEAAKRYKHSSTPKKYEAAKYHKDELSRKEMEEASKQYQHSTQPNKYEAAKHNEKEMNRADMEKKAALWPQKNSAQTEVMKTSEPRLWPKKKSARQITDFLKKH